MLLNAIDLRLSWYNGGCSFVLNYQSFLKLIWVKDQRKYWDLKIFWNFLCELLNMHVLATIKVPVGITVFFLYFSFQCLFTFNFETFNLGSWKKNPIDFLICKVYCIVNKISFAKTEASYVMLFNKKLKIFNECFVFLTGSMGRLPNMGILWLSARDATPLPAKTSDVS